nr:MAG TPA: hypothetical protein [Caudoviricetes sp.]
MFGIERYNFKDVYHHFLFAACFIIATLAYVFQARSFYHSRYGFRCFLMYVCRCLLSIC